MNAVSSRSFRNVEGPTEFEFLQLTPGTWTAHLEGQGFHCEPIEVHVPDGGAREVVLEFVRVE